MKVYKTAVMRCVGSRHALGRYMASLLAHVPQRYEQLGQAAGGRRQAVTSGAEVRASGGRIPRAPLATLAACASTALHNRPSVIFHSVPTPTFLTVQFVILSIVSRDHNNIVSFQ